MSLPFKIIECDACGFKAYSTCLWGLFDYVAPDGSRLNIHRTYGWCYTCQDISPVEKLPDASKIMADIDTQAQGLAFVEKSGFIKKKLLLLIGKENRRTSILKSEIESKKRLLAFIRLRKTPPKCLSCSGTDFELIKLPNPHGATVVKIMDFTHPGCGGNLLVRNSEWWVNIASTTKEYNLDGMQI